MYSTKIVGKTRYGIPIFRIDFDSGEWWELHAERSWGTGQAIRLASKGLDDHDDDEHLMVLKEATNLAGLVGSTVAWSWESECTSEEIPQLPEFEVQIASRELAAHHVAGMLKMEEVEKKVLRGHWLTRIRYRITGSMSTFIGRASKRNYTNR